LGALAQARPARRRKTRLSVARARSGTGYPLESGQLFRHAKGLSERGQNCPCLRIQGCHEIRQRIIRRDDRTKLSLVALSHPMPNACSSTDRDLLGRAHFQRRNGNSRERRRHAISVGPVAAATKGTSIAREGSLRPQCVLVDPRLPSPAPEILDYLARRPDAQDTIDGILHWWVFDAYIQKWAPKIAKTVAQLVEQGFLEERRSADGNVFYRVSPRYLSTVQQRPPQNSPLNATP
jgi:hypothetical protein